ncbi:hypothetical protein [Hallella colorans]|uniref:hypothetical protein n=1 Tax=Hallella colorans TaxID=1703337 RepID=UPI00288ADFC9|nr:hypothetical protein [Hallella colorans]
MKNKFFPIIIALKRHVRAQLNDKTIYDRVAAIVAWGREDVEHMGMSRCSQMIKNEGGWGLFCYLLANFAIEF